MPIWKPFMAWMAAWALAGLSKLTKPEGRGASGRRPRRLGPANAQTPAQQLLIDGTSERVRPTAHAHAHTGTFARVLWGQPLSQPGIEPAC